MIASNFNSGEVRMKLTNGMRDLVADSQIDFQEE